ncbi:MAG: protein-L-isoaspartate(D-aspartate) O-methyltransferase [Planctomycetota bacterium]
MLNRTINAALTIVILFAGSLCFNTVAEGQGSSDEYYQRQREQMVEQAVKGAGVTDERVIAAMLATPRHEFVPRRIRREQSYLDAGIPIGESQTISSPFIVAYMTESLDPQPTDKVLEIGTGSGYQAAVLSPLVADVYSIEIVEPLGRKATEVLEDLDYENVHVRIGDGFQGWPEYAPFDKIIVTCSPESIPQPLVDQLAEGGMVVVPMGERHQQTLYRLKKVNGELEAQPLRPTLFVPMTGEAEDNRQVLPDPKNPELLNADFEQGLDEEGFLSGWYYQRQMEYVEEVLAPSGQFYVKFNNDIPGQAAHVMQGFAVDGREVSKLELSAAVSCENVRVGPHREDLPVVGLTFYGEGRDVVGMAYIGPFQNSMTWRNFRREVEVPEDAREAIVRIGMFGSTGSVSFDSVQVRKVTDESDR